MEQCQTTWDHRREKRHLCSTRELLKVQKIIVLRQNEHGAAQPPFSPEKWADTRAIWSGFGGMTGRVCLYAFSCYHMSTLVILEANTLRAIYLSSLETISRLMPLHFTSQNNNNNNKTFSVDILLTLRQSFSIARLRISSVYVDPPSSNRQKASKKKKHISFNWQ